MICCIASLNDYINRNKQNQVVYSQRRNYPAKQAKELLHMDVKVIQDKIYRLSPECYPSLKAAGRVCDMPANKSVEKVIDNSFVPDKLMRYLSFEEAKRFHNIKKYNQDKPEQLKEHEIEKLAIRRLCMTFDIYYSDRLFDAALKQIERFPTLNMVSAYMEIANLKQSCKKSYDDTIAEEDLSQELV